MMMQITMLLNDEAQEDQQQRTRFGTQLWQRPASELANRELREQEAQLLHTFSSATQSDHSVKKRYEDWRNAIEILCQDEVSVISISGRMTYTFFQHVSF
jgi:hypothetical protein